MLGKVATALLPLARHCTSTHHLREPDLWRDSSAPWLASKHKSDSPNDSDIRAAFFLLTDFGLIQEAQQESCQYTFSRPIGLPASGSSVVSKSKRTYGIIPECPLVCRVQGTSYHSREAAKSGDSFDALAVLEGISLSSWIGPLDLGLKLLHVLLVLGFECAVFGLLRSSFQFSCFWQIGSCCWS